MAKTYSTAPESAKNTYRYMSIGTSAVRRCRNHVPSPAPDAPLEELVHVRLATSTAPPDLTSPLSTGGVVPTTPFCLRPFLLIKASSRSPLSLSSSSLVSVIPTSKSVDEKENNESLRVCSAARGVPVYEGIRHFRFFVGALLPVSLFRRVCRSSWILRCRSRRRLVCTCAVTCSAKNDSARSDIIRPTALYSSTMIGCESTPRTGASCTLYARSGESLTSPPWSRALWPFVSVAMTSCRPTWRQIIHSLPGSCGANKSPVILTQYPVLKIVAPRKLFLTKDIAIFNNNI